MKVYLDVCCLNKPFDDQTHDRIRLEREDADVEKRAIDLESLGFNPFGALYMSCAEESKVDVLLTIEDILLRKAVQNKDVLNVRVRNPVKWLI